MYASNSVDEIIEMVPMDAANPNTLVSQLSRDEDMFALAVVENGGNVGQAYRAVFGTVSNPQAKGMELLSRPSVQARVLRLQGSVNSSVLITMETHMLELSNIRALAKAQNQLKVALQAEELRGKAAGYYTGKGDAAIPQAPHIDKLAMRLMAMMPDSPTDVEHREV